MMTYITCGDSIYMVCDIFSLKHGHMKIDQIFKMVNDIWRNRAALWVLIYRIHSAAG